MSDRQARRMDIARTVHELRTLIDRLDDYQRTDPDLVATESADIETAALALLTVTNAVLKRQIK